MKRWWKRAEQAARAVEENVEAVKEETADEKRLREDVAIERHDLERRLAHVIAQGQVLRKGTG